MKIPEGESETDGMNYYKLIDENRRDDLGISNL